MNPIERALRKVDHFQQRHNAVAVPFAVVKKFGDDRGGALAALLAYYGMLSLFPLLLLTVTIFGFLIGRNPSLERSVLHSALAQFPIVGDQIQRNIHAVRATGLGAIVGAVGLLWGGLGVTQAAQHAMNEVWDVPGVARPGFLPRMARGLLFLITLGTGVVGTTVLSGLAQVGDRSAGFRVGYILLATLLNVGLFIAAFRVLTPKSVPLRQLIPGAVIAGVAWQILQSVGGYLVAHQLKNASQVYGFFAVVLGLLTWIYLAAQITLYCAELNVVLARRLWPRSILQPPLTGADKKVLTGIAAREERRPEEKVSVTFE
jgi:YihY family inner membrane protein